LIEIFVGGDLARAGGNGTCSSAGRGENEQISSVSKKNSLVEGVLL